VDIFSFGELPDGRCYFVMEWLEGESLARRLKRGPIALDEAIAILDQICGALQAAHQKGVIHRDLKPDNIFLFPRRTGPPAVKLLDFGLAKLASEPDGRRLDLTQSGAMLGTPRYVSPEQARGKNVDHRTDIYSLGVMAFEMIVGRRPFESDSVID